LKILIVDDELNQRKLIKYNLSIKRHIIILAEDGKQGLELAISENPDLILLDIMMPEMNGIEVCEKIKSHKNTKDIPVFMLTAKTQIRDIDEAFMAGADDYITKPVDVLRLNDIIKRKLAKINKP